jgi:hypothetical protein
VDTGYWPTAGKSKHTGHNKGLRSRTGGLPLDFGSYPMNPAAEQAGFCPHPTILLFFNSPQITVAIRSERTVNTDCSSVLSTLYACGTMPVSPWLSFPTVPKETSRTELRLRRPSPLRSNSPASNERYARPDGGHPAAAWWRDPIYDKPRTPDAEPIRPLSRSSSRLGKRPAYIEAKEGRCDVVHGDCEHGMERDMRVCHDMNFG